VVSEFNQGFNRGSARNFGVRYWHGCSGNRLRSFDVRSRSIRKFMARRVVTSDSRTRSFWELRESGASEMPENSIGK
jgi:hypothetical protein